MDSKAALSLTDCTRRARRLLETRRSLSASPGLEAFLQSFSASSSEMTGCETTSTFELEKDRKLGVREVADKTCVAHYSEENFTI